VFWGKIAVNSPVSVLLLPGKIERGDDGTEAAGAPTSCQPVSQDHRFKYYA
jgi:hypothetical protein